MIRAASKPKEQKYLSLKEITLNSRPLVRRAIQFSCDGDLAVAADDSVHVFVPEFPDLAKRRERWKAAANGNPDYPAEALYSDGEDVEDDEDDSAPGRYNRVTVRAQYSEGSKHMPVSYPPIDPRVNRELFLAADIPFPYEGAPDADAHSDDSNDDSAASAASDSEGEDDGASLGFNRPYGAGYGPITGVGSSMNHVVGIKWSPSGLGVNRRPILAVLTGSGTLTMYGEGSEFTNILPRANDGMLQRRELNSWVVLWGVGERMMVPGQQTKISEYIRSFAWAREIAPGQGLLATANDTKEIAIISVQCVYVADETKPAGPDPGETSVWLVREVARFKAEGPHEDLNPMDLDWTPCGTSFGLSWGPWLDDGNCRTCVLSYVDRNYVGFRKITLQDPWVRGELPNLDIGGEDAFGKCLHLSTDAFVEFEDVTWNQGPMKTCRGIIAAGFYIAPFEVALTGGPIFQQEKHSVWDCQTVYDDSGNQSQDPIVDLIIHPPDIANPSDIPLYSLIRMSATSTTKDWYQTNVPPPPNGDPSADPRPQWARTIAQKLDVQVPLDMFRTRTYDENDSDSEVASDSASDLDMDADDFDSQSDQQSVDGEEGNQEFEIPQIHPHRFRLHGLTISPGGGVTAVLVSNHSTQHPERGGWHTIKSSILFGHKPRRRGQRQQEQQAPYAGYDPLIDPQVMNWAPGILTASTDPRYAQLTTEAKLFEYLYGGAPEVPGVHYPLSSGGGAHGNDHPAGAELRALFAPLLATQTCDLCGSRMSRERRGSGGGVGALTGCEKGHFFGTCATSGLAVQTPGGTRSCGACGLRTVRAEVLVAKMPPERRGEVRALVADGVCGACGGKFLS